MGRHPKPKSPPRAVLAISQLETREKVDASRAILTKASDSPTLKSSKPLQQAHRDFAQATGDLDAALKALDAARKVVEAAEQTVAVKEAALVQRGNVYCLHVNTTPGLDDPLIAELGLRSIPRRGAPKPMTPPTQLRTRVGREAGETFVRWKPVPGAHGYFVQVTEDPAGETGWVEAAAGSRSMQVLRGLTAGKRVWVRVAAIGPSGTSAYSSPVAVSVFS